MKFYIKKEDNNEENIFWITMTDLMTAMVLVFIVLFFYSYLSSFYDKINIAKEQEKAATALNETLNAQNIHADIDAATGIVKIQDLELFEINSHLLSSKGKAYLEKFTPAYFDSLISNEYLNQNLEKIIILGHTDSQTFKGKYSDDEQYMKNMELSLKRAYEVANFMANTPYNKYHGNKLRKMITVEGASFAEPIIINGKEDYSKSRRVELKLVLAQQKSKKSNSKP